MKTIKFIILGIIFALAIVSCDNPISLGSKLDLSGPEVNFTSPLPRKAVTASFLLEGTATDTSDVGTMIIKVERNREELPRQWRNLGAGWEVSEDSGVSWNPLPGCSWEGTKSVVWSVLVDLTEGNLPPEDGEYMFIAQAWDKAEISDDNSYKTLILIVDNDPPKVSISRPLMYDRHLTYDPITDKFDNTTADGKELELLRDLTHWRYPEYISKFQAGSFPLQWGIEENFNIWSFDLRFYKMDAVIDENKNTPLPDNYIYRFHQNTLPIPDAPSPSDYVKPNGTVTVPALTGTVGDYGANGELKEQITGKTTIRVVSVCYDAANNATQEKTLGYFIYWPDADIPWITFSGDLKEPEYYNNNPTPNAFAGNIEGAFMVYPGVKIKAIAFHAQGIQSVTYEIKKIDESGGLKSPYSSNTLTQQGLDNKGKTLINSQSSRGKFDWEFLPDPRSAYYIVEAKTLSTSGRQSVPITVVFRVQDITFPGFPRPVQPPALEPLFQHITSDSITISGVVDDATEIDTLCLVWINPQSKSAAANAQLQYFREPDYIGWKSALGLSPGGAYTEEGHFDSSQPNKLWKLAVTKSTDYPGSINPETQRVEYKFSKTIPLSDLNIGIGKQPLKSQVFLLRAANKNPRVTIITYTPQGDEAPPVIEITGATVNHSGGTPESLTPGQFSQISILKGGDKITVTGNWTESSVKFLPFNTYLKDNFIISINGMRIPPGNLTFTDTSDGKGTWTATAEVGVTPLITEAILKDTLVVAARLSDIGKNESEVSSSWLVESEKLRIVRISSELADQTYNAGKAIDFFIEFNKPVQLKAGRSSNPVLTMKVGDVASITATYKPSPTQNTRQYFTYTVAQGHNTNTANPWLDVTGLSGLAGGSYWEAINYPFTWESVSGAGTKEEIRVTMNSGHTEQANLAHSGALLRRLPVSANTDDLPYTLVRGKNIGIDTTPPSVTRVSTTNREGHYPLNSVIDINVTFNEPVTIGATPPQLNLQLTGKTAVTAGAPKANDRTVTFSYKVSTGDTTEDNKLSVISFTGNGITDIAGTAITSLQISNGTLNGGSDNNGTGVYVNDEKPGVPTFRALKSNNNTDIIRNDIDGTIFTGESGGSAKDIKNYYGDQLWFAIIPNSTGGNNKIGYLEYTLDNVNWKRIDSISGAPFQYDIQGNYTVRTRQTDKAGNTGAVSQPVTLNWDPGNLVSRIDSTSANGTYTKNSARSDSINVTVYFRKSLNVSGTPSINLNIAQGATNGINITGSSTSNSNLLSFTYVVGNTDNTPAGTGRAQYLDATAWNITARDAGGVLVTDYIKMPASNDDKLGYRKDILVQTGALTLSSGPVYAISKTNDEATGTITFTFNRSISKRTGNITIKQQTNGYRLPAVLTETQANRYKSAAGFNTYYSKGTNGFENGAVDTSTKYVLNYEQTTVVNPTNTSGINKMAYDFLTAESVTLPVSSQDVNVSGNTLTITLSGSNALQVLGATYDITIPDGLVQDGLSFQWPATGSSTGRIYNYTNPNINRPFVRVDKKTNKDRITTAAGDDTMPWLMADFSGLIQTRARLDCRTPNANVRYTASGTEHTATGADSRGSRPGQNWKNVNDNADQINYLTQQNPGALTGGTTYTTFTGETTNNSGPYIEVGNNNESGYVWRIGVVSSKGTTANDNSQLFEEIAFRTVLTYQLDNLSSNNLGVNLSKGDQLWIRGGDAVGSSSVAGFPINWQDSFPSLESNGKRAGVRLLRRISVNNNMNTTSVWRWITWEINVRTYHDVVLGRGEDINAGQGANDAWQYGPRQWAYQRGGWSALKDEYTLYPGKHRWCRISNDASYNPGGLVNFSLQPSIRSSQAVTLTQPPATP
jgi:hypothetical protein